jgi:hypothetical protein
LLTWGTAAWANPQLEADWLFQCDNAPSVGKAKREAELARQMLGRISVMGGAGDLSGQGAALAEVEARLSAAAEDSPATARELYLAVRRIKRAVAFANPLVDFDKVLLIDNPYPRGVPGDVTDEWGHEARHRNGFMRQVGGRLLVVGLEPGGKVTDVLEGQAGSFWRPDVSYDGSKILFSFCPESDRSFHLYECNADGSGLRQLTRGDYDDLDPVYAPDGKIIFCTSRQHSYVRCGPFIHSFAVARCDADGKNIYVISANGEPDYLPSIMNDGRVMFTRWEYTDKALWRVQSLWTMDPDGCNVQTLWGSQSVWPDVLTEARAVPGSAKVFFTGVGHHAWFDGSIGVIDPAQGLNYPDGLLRVTRDAPWPEVGNGPKDPPAHVEYSAAGKFYAYKTPWPLSEEYFLVSAREGKRLYSGDEGGGRNDTFRLYLMDVYGNKELIYRGQFNALHAMPFRARTPPPAIADKVKWPRPGERPEPAVFYSNNVFENAPDILRGKGKALRVVQMDPKTYTTWHKTVQHDGPAVSVFQADGVKRVLGTVPIEDDGSVNFLVPPGEAVFFQMLDAKGEAIYVMRSFANGMPGERRGCFGCHETGMKNRGVQSASSYKMGKALQKPPVKLQEPPWGAGESVSYPRFVQPVLDKHCAGCHQKEGTDAFKRLNMVYRPSTHGWWGWVHHRPGDVSPFMEPYYSLVDGACGWGGSKPKDERGVPRNLAGLFIVEGYGPNDVANLETLPPYAAFSPVSTLVQNATSGRHHGMRVTGVERERLVAWVDCNGPFLGDEEIRAMYDPWLPSFESVPPIRPRIATAPVINRFDLRQDGDTTAICGPLKLQPDRPERFDPNAALKRFHAEARHREITTEGLTVELVGAEYGAGDTRANVLEALRKNFLGHRYIPSDTYNAMFGDPARNVVKTLRVAYTINGGDVRHIEFTEDAEIILPR